jgi:hypothetical protein
MAVIRKPTLLLAMALCAAIDASGCSVIVESQTHNAFDEMYLSVKHPTEEGPRFGRMEPIVYGGLSEDIWVEGHYFGGYGNSLEEGESIFISINVPDATISILGCYEVADTRCVTIVYRYLLTVRTLTIEPVSLMTRNHIEMGVEFDIDDDGQLAAYFAEQGVTREDIERCRDYFLYEKVLTDWVTCNGVRSRFSPGDFGDFTVIDDTFANLGEDWR